MTVSGWIVSIPVSIWSAVASALLGSLIAGGVVALLTQRWIEKRERRDRRDQLRLDLYLEVVDLVLDNELAIAERGADGAIPSTELQQKRLRISHRLKLLGTSRVRDAYGRYRQIVFKETAKPAAFRPSDPDEVVRARDRLLEVMSEEV